LTDVIVIEHASPRKAQRNQTTLCTHVGIINALVPRPVVRRTSGGSVSDASSSLVRLALNANGARGRATSRSLASLL
jgi:hypothetical protein